MSPRGGVCGQGTADVAQESTTGDSNADNDVGKYQEIEDFRCQGFHASLVAARNSDFKYCVQPNHNR